MRGAVRLPPPQKKNPVLTKRAEELKQFCSFMQSLCVGHDSSVGIATREWNPGGDKIFRNRPDRPWCPPSLLYNGYRIFPGGKAAGSWRWLPTTSSAEVKERVELYLYSNSVPSWPVIGWTLPTQSLCPLTVDCWMVFEKCNARSTPSSYTCCDVHWIWRWDFRKFIVNDNKFVI
jgi:hypothetical protein